MQVISRTKPQPFAGPLSGEGDAATRNTLLSLYGNLPSVDISIEEFERIALERLRGELMEQCVLNFHLTLALRHCAVLKGIEDLRLRGKKDDEIMLKAKELTDKHLMVRGKQRMHHYSNA